MELVSCTYKLYRGGAATAMRVLGGAGEGVEYAHGSEGEKGKRLGGGWRRRDRGDHSDRGDCSGCEDRGDRGEGGRGENRGSRGIGRGEWRERNVTGHTVEAANTAVVVKDVEVTVFSKSDGYLLTLVIGYRSRPIEAQ